MFDMSISQCGPQNADVSAAAELTAMRWRGGVQGQHLMVLAALLLFSAHAGVWMAGAPRRASAAGSAAEGRAARLGAAVPVRPGAVSERDKVAGWLDRVAAGAASVPARLLESRAGAHDPAVARLRALAARVDAEEAALSDAAVIWPRVFVIGAPKAASSTLSRLMSRHPQLCSARPLGKARQAKEVGILFAHRLRVYLQRMYGRAGTGGADPRCARATERARSTGAAPRLLYMDNHPLYLHAAGNFSAEMQRRVPERLHPEMRFIVLVREPVTRALSQLLHQRRPTCRWWCDEANRGRLSQEDMLAELLNPASDAVSRSRYAVDLASWLERWPRRNLLVLSSEQLLADTASTQHVLRRVASFLNVSGDAAEWNGTAIHSETRNASPRQYERLHALITAHAAPSTSPAADATAPKSSRAARLGDLAFQRFNCSTQARIMDVFARHNRALFDLLRRTRSEAPAEQETLDSFRDPRSPECFARATPPLAAR